MLDGKHVGGTDDPFEFQLGRGVEGTLFVGKERVREAHVVFWMNAFQKR